MKRTLLLIGILMTVSVPSQSFFAANDRLVEGCRYYSLKGDSDSFGECMSYASAVADILAYAANYNLRACIPSDSVTNGQMIAVINKSLSEHPVQTNDSAMLLVAAALSTAFTCRQ